MNRVLSVVFGAGIVLVAATVAFAQMGGMGMGAGGMGYGGMGYGMGSGMMGSGVGPRGQAGQPAAPEQITQQGARELAQQYADRHLKGYTVEHVLPFAGRRGTAYSVELKGPAGEVRTLHVNPWGDVVPFDASQRRPG
jgi:hypothetical protein